MDDLHARVRRAIEQAMALAAQVEKLKALTRRTIHDARNSRHHAALLRVLARAARGDRALS